MLQIKNIHKTFTVGKHKLKVLNGVSFELEEGKSLAIIGKSGAGKSTLLHIIGGLDKPDKKAEKSFVMLNGKNLYELSFQYRTRMRITEIGFVFQSYHLLPEMDVLQNVMLPGMALSRYNSKRTLQECGRDLLKAVGLEDRMHHCPMELSGGEQQRVALARALMNNPKLLLVDEPTGNLDEGTGTKVLEHLFALSCCEGHALIIVTHDKQIAFQCDRVLQLENGVLVS